LIVTLSKILAARQKLATQPRLPRLREPRRTLKILMVTLVTSIIVTMTKKSELLRRSKRFTKKKKNKLRRI
jgi:hypothetical protein